MNSADVSIIMTANGIKRSGSFVEESSEDVGMDFEAQTLTPDRLRRWKDRYKCTKVDHCCLATSLLFPPAYESV